LLELLVAASEVIRLKASNLSPKKTYLLTEWFIVLHFASKNTREKI